MCGHHTKSHRGLVGTRSNAYWKANLRLIALCLTLWGAVSYGCGILFVEQLNHFSLGGYKLGFWFAQQGAMYVFVALIFFYNWRVTKLDQRYRAERDTGDDA
ncbi:MAG: DUF4212 domain-containing protein [Nitrospira sp. SB0672_bin_25]|nr:DUF4212 domain-containing protein [Nitrospira sp. SB0666_bin_27]MYC27760.1 DUF4212 domain-containing protein [Nitrospira sp. SB0662_bin_26]MYF25408.1 DUF4212 domain-containing protein [Nitrospira sp. SB0678_bin_10]MYJ53663.1 DUF4212 domain-containing protein [Nitrospira sp. SB0672_bin_25]